MKKRKLWWGAKQEYTPLKYLESSGTQYIDTGWSPQSNNLKIRFRATSTGSPQGTAICGAEKNSIQPRWVFVLYGQNADASKIFPLIGDWNNKTDGFTFTSGTTIDIEWSTNATSTKVIEYISDTTYTYTYGSTMNFQNNDTTLKIFQNADGQGSSIRLSSYQIIDNNVLVRDMIPVLDKHGVPCMWDRVNNELYYNEGTGTFAYEEWDYTPVDHVYANGNAYTSTMLYGNSDTKMEMVFDIANTSTQNRGLMGSRGSSANNQLLAIGYGTSTAASDFNNSSYSTYRSYIEYNTNTKYRVYTSKEKRSFIDEATGTVLNENNTLCNDNMSTGVLLLGAETGLNYRHVGNIYRAKVWDGSLLVRDYIPVVDENNVAGMYDKCLNIIFYSIGSSEFEGHIVDGNNDYKVVHYIEAAPSSTSSGPYIDTGVNYFADFEIKAKQRTSASMKGCGVDQTHCVERENATTNAWRFRNGESTLFNTSALVTDLHALKWRNNKVYVDGTLLGSFTKDSVSQSFLVFGINATGTNPVNRYPLLVWGLKLWNPNSDELVRNFIPVIQNTTRGLYDIQNKVFYTNAGTGSFTTG